MGKLSPAQQRTRARVETMIRIMAPGLNLLLAAGDRISRLIEPEDHGYYPPQVGAAAAPPPRPPRDGER